MAFNLLQRFHSIVGRGLREVRTTLSRWTTPISYAPLLGTVADLARSKPQLVAENLLLRQ